MALGTSGDGDSVNCKQGMKYSCLLKTDHLCQCDGYLSPQTRPPPRPPPRLPPAAPLRLQGMVYPLVHGMTDFRDGTNRRR